MSTMISAYLSKIAWMEGFEIWLKGGSYSGLKQKNPNQVMRPGQGFHRLDVSVLEI